VIQKNLILSFADELGLDVTDEEIAKQLISIPGFLKDGKFDKDTYVRVLAQNRTKPKEFEETLKRDLLLQKIESIFKIQASKVELENLSKLLFSQDDISIEILNSKDIKLNITDEDVKNYWESNKNNYKSQPAIELEIDEVSLVSETFTTEEIEDNYKKFRTDYKKEDGKIKSFEEAKEDIRKALNTRATKKEALKKYLKFKKGEMTFDKKDTIQEFKLAFGTENNKKITDSIPGSLLKPFLVGNKYVIVKVLNKIAPKELSFEKAKKLALNDYKKVAKSMELETKANKKLDNFKGTDIGFVSRDSVDKINGLNKEEALTFLNSLFSSAEKQGKITVGNKIVLYKIKDTKLVDYDNSKDEAVKTTINN